MIETTKDILYIVLAFCVLWLTIFISWAFYYLAMVLKEARKIVYDVRLKVQLAEKVVLAFKDRVERSSSYMKLFVESAINVMNFLKEHKAEKKEKKTRGRKKKK